MRPGGARTGLRRRRPPYLALAVGLLTVTMLAVLGYLLAGLGALTADVATARTVSAQTANGNRDVLVFHRDLVRLASIADSAERRAAARRATTRRDAALRNLKVLVVQTSGAGTEALDRQAREFQRFVSEIRDIDPVALAARADRVAALRDADRRLTGMEQRFKTLYDARDQDFHALTVRALSARGATQRWLAVVIALNLLAAGAWAVRLRRRSRGAVEVARRAMHDTEERYRSLVQNSTDLTILVGPDGAMAYVSPAALTITGRPVDDLTGTAFLELVHVEDRAVVELALDRLRSVPGRRQRLEFRSVHIDGGVRHLDAIASNLVDDPAVAALVVNVRDESERHRLEAELAHQAFHDPLTGLPNRSLLRERIEHAAARASRSEDAGAALILIDLDDFKAVNDGLGHAEGDRLLMMVAQRLLETVRPGDTVARLGGDEFVVFAEDLEDEADAVALAERLRRALATPLLSRSDVPPAAASVGVRFTRAGEIDADDLLRDADLAMYAAKAQGKGAAMVFEPEMHDTASVALALRADLHRALERDELVLRYEPVVEIDTGIVTGFEALVRWEHPERGLLGPGAFIGIAEESGLIRALGAWVIAKATAAVRRLEAATGREDLTISVNLSPLQIGDPGLDLAVRDALSATGLPARRLMLEVTESLFLADSTMVSACLGRLRDLGVQLALDDFGTGFSSLGYLERLPLDVLKVDRSFVFTLGGEESRGVLVATIVRLAEVLGLRTIAEGVENPGQLATLHALGCHHAQGYLFARPLTEDAARDLLLGTDARRRRGEPTFPQAYGGEALAVLAGLPG